MNMRLRNLLSQSKRQQPPPKAYRRSVPRTWSLIHSSVTLRWCSTSLASLGIRTVMSLVLEFSFAMQAQASTEADHVVAKIRSRCGVVFDGKWQGPRVQVKRM